MGVTGGARRGRSVVARIEELVLDGIPVADRRGVAAALEAELARLAAGQDDLRAVGPSRSVDSITTGPVDVGPRWTAEAIGRHAAQAVWQGVLGGQAAGGEGGSGHAVS
jgi:hypothetical protein